MRVSAAEIVGGDEVVEVPAQLFVIVLVKALDGGVLDGPAHELDLAVRPGMFHRGTTMFDAVLIANNTEREGAWTIGTT